ncbi:MAG: tRNA (guanosine(37)-N1)-methyltransferase TrmD [Deltaproteobacteria bacterium]|nr:tRNA (guanosine(37)-N1)-methyltransferase TrmD [Deltaproteobacteria bacterium]MBW2010748.1 tRNA (guanosine(37)-N1)-methyltransferase TrmD [Deltaproteobacteria bacterium]
MDFDVLTIFPEMFKPFWEHGMIRRAIEQDKISASAINIRDFAKGRHSPTDDRPYGGGCGMVMKPEPLAAAIRAAKKKSPSSKTILATPQGRSFDQDLARELALQEGLILVCGRYEGVDERICNDFIDEEISIGDYVLTGGELPAMVIIDAVTRLIPGVLGGVDSAEKDSFSGSLLEYAHYTRPGSFEGEEVPDVLLSGNHKAIENWRLEMSLKRTFLKRPDLLENRPLNKQEIKILEKWCLDLERIIQA